MSSALRASTRKSSSSRSRSATVLQARELVGDGRREEIGPRGQHLPELDEDAATVLEGPAHAEGHRRAAVGCRFAVVLRHAQ
jgi:hypothetical protein